MTRDAWRDALLREQYAAPVPEFLSRPTSTSDMQAELDAELVDELTIARRRRDLVDALEDAGEVAELEVAAGGDQT